MEDGRRDDVAEVVAARRFELVDPAGQVRAVVGDVSRRAEVWGLNLMDQQGHERLLVALLDIGPLISLVEAGNVVAEFGLADATEDAVVPGPSLRLMRPGRTVALGWRVGPDRPVVSEGEYSGPGPAPRSPRTTTRGPACWARPLGCGRRLMEKRWIQPQDEERLRELAIGGQSGTA